MVDGRHVARRAFHVAVSLCVLYYWLPDRIAEVGATKQQLAVAGVVAVALLEAVRLQRKALVFPMREYERRQLGGHFWLLFGCLVALVLFEERFAFITILGTTLVDPLIGELRSREPTRRFVAPAGFAMWCAVAMACIFLVPLTTPLALVPLGGAAAIIAEVKKVKHVDDNFLMNVVPLILMTVVARAAGL